MVYRGPSLGCKRCIQRHKACNKGRPSCGRCLAGGFACPGYNDTGGVVFRDVTAIVVKRETKRAVRKSSGKRTLEVTKNSDPNFVKFTVSLAPRLDAFAASVYFFCDKYLPSQEWYPLLSRGHFDHLPDLYSNAAPTSPLALAAGLMGARAMFLYHGLAQTDPILSAQELAATCGVRAAIGVEEERLSDQTLLAVLCMDFAEHVKSRGTGGAASKAHTNGALALIRGRGADSFRTSASRSLFAGTMCNVLHRALWADQEQDDSAFMLLPTLDLGNMNPVIELHQQLLELLRLDRLLNANVRDLSNLQKCKIMGDAGKLSERTLGWPDRVPAKWQRFARPGSGSSASLFECYDDGSFPHMQVAYIWSQWYCTRLLAIQMLHLSFATLHEGTQDQTPSLQALLSEAHALTHELRSLLPYFVAGRLAASPFVGVSGEMLERNAGGYVMDRTGLSSVFVGGAPKGPNYLLNILTWVVSLLTDRAAVASGFVMDASVTMYFEDKLHRVSAELTSLG